MSAAAPPSWSLDVASAARQIRDGTLTPSALLDSVLGRVERAEPFIHALVLVDRAGAQEQAEALEAELAQGRARGPLHGIPIAIKDLFDIRGMPTRAGSGIYHDARPAAEDSTVVARLRAAGAIIYAKAVTHELAIGDTTPEVANPWDLARTAGGSSGGSAAAVAAGIAPAALGSDTGGSIRNPAAFTGLVGLKPTYGRVSRAGGVVLAWSLDHVGPLARTVDDAALVLAAIAGPDPRDPTASSRPLGDLGRDPGDDLRGRRLGVPRELFFDGIDRHARTAFDQSRAGFEALGASVLDVSVPELEGVYLAEMVVAFVEAAAYHRRRLAERGALIKQDEDRLWLEIGALLPATAFVKAQRIRARLQQGLARAFREQRLDALLVPGAPGPAPRFDHLVYDYGDRREALGDAVVRTACPFNLAGLPALALPVTVSPEGLPIGIQLAGRPWAEETVLALGRAFERRARFRQQHPEPLGLAQALRAAGG